MEGFAEFWQRVIGFLDTPLLRTEQTSITIRTVLLLLVVIPLLFWTTGVAKRWVGRTILPRTRLNIHAAEAVGTVLRYVVVVVGSLVILQTAGIDVTALSLLVGGLGLGVGLGLQNVANNFVSGLIVLFERPVKIGDRIHVEEVEGDVVAINARSTTVVTNDGIAIIVPNSKFISENVINWSYTDRTVRFRIPVAVAYGTDPHVVRRALLEVAHANEDVQEQPEPGVWFMEFGDNGMHFELRVWTTRLAHRRGRLVSALNFAIADAFRSRGIEIPFPQRDVWLREGRKGRTAEGRKEGETETRTDGGTGEAAP